MPSVSSGIRVIPIRTSHDKQWMTRKKPANCTYEKARDDLGLPLGRADLEHGEEEVRKAACCRLCRDNKDCRVGILTVTLLHEGKMQQRETEKDPGCGFVRESSIDSFVIRG
eukprot:gnl/TRDRNA2_/TRDRNA2_177767_c1_seq4.p1 gnl/TRDRNA2_/TRDRNA2_177767_c1~~gnl/TRDRNA2_/TRDRNA2_177767_c1_seq4.p1  ORF type:complete len:112 (+),score=5.26 gnl/TRDRNA2_/TRDRNA2_177767_c1_seq4:623-958(+)